MGDKPHLSASALTMLFKCGEQYRRRYVLGEKIPPGISAHKGRGVHLGAEHDLKQKANTGALLPLEAVQDLARDGVMAGVSEGVLWTPDDEAEGTERLVADAIDGAVRLAGVHHAELAPKIEPIDAEHVERRWDLALEGFPFDLMGYYDVCEATSVRDLKTKAKAPSASDV